MRSGVPFADSSHHGTSHAGIAGFIALVLSLIVVTPDNDDVAVVVVEDVEEVEVVGDYG